MTHFFHNGTVKMYQKATCQHGKWFARIKRPHTTGYIHRVLTTDLIDSAGLAREIYEQMAANPHVTSESFVLTYRDLYAKWHHAEVQHKSEARRSHIEFVNETYLLPYWGDVRVTDIVNRRIPDYWQWRLDNARSGRPCGSTLDLERHTFLQCLGWGRLHDFVHRLPDMPLPFARTRAQDTRRPAFNVQHEQELMAMIEASKPDVDTQRGYGEFMVQEFARLGLLTGLRPNEMYSLTWRDVDAANEIVNVPAGTKTGRRRVVGRKGCGAVLKRIAGRSRYTQPDDPVFTTIDGARISSYARSFKNMLDRFGLLHDEAGSERTPYSLRHTYISRMLARTDIRSVARNAGTSVKMIERHYDHVLNELDHSLR